MADPVFFAYAAASALVFAILMLEEVPWAFNVARVARRVRTTASRKRITQAASLDRIRRQTRLGGRVLGGFGVAATLFLVFDLVFGDPQDAAVLLLKATLSIGLVALALAFLGLAPKLFDAVAHGLVKESATTNSHASDAEPAHGPRP